MNIKEFAALKVGDKIESPAHGGASVGEIVETTPSGVRVVWGPRHTSEHRFFYPVVGTAWMQWNKVDAPAPATRLAEGCCSSVLPCSWQQQHPESICETCKTAQLQAAAQNKVEL